MPLGIRFASQMKFIAGTETRAQPCEAGKAGTEFAPGTAMPLDVKYFGRHSCPRSDVRQPVGSSRMMKERPTGVTAFPVAMRPPATRSRNGTFDPVDELNTASVCP